MALYILVNGFMNYNAFKNFKIINIFSKLHRFFLAKKNQNIAGKTKSLFYVLNDYMQNNELKPTILIITELFPYNDSSFIGTFVVNQIKALQQNYNFVVIVPRFFNFSIKKQILKQQNNIHVFYIKQHSFFINHLQIKNF